MFSSTMMRLQLVDARGGPGERDIASHDSLDRCVSQTVSDRLVEVAPGHDAHHASVGPHADAGMAIPLRGDQSLGDRRVGVDETDRAAHDLAGGGHPDACLGQGLQQSRPRPGCGVSPRDHARRCLGVASTLDDVKKGAHVHRPGSRPGGHEDPVFHAHRLQQHLSVDQLHELVRDDAQAIDVGRDVYRHHVDVHASDPLDLHRIHHLHEHLPLLLGERAVEKALDQGLGGAQAHRGGEHLGIADGGARIGQRTGVFVDAQSEDGRLQAGDLDPSLPEDVEHRRGLGSVGGQHPIVPLHESGALRILGLVVVEHDGLHVAAPAELRQVADPFRVGRIDDDQPLDLALVDLAKTHDGQRLAVERDELAHVGIERAREDDAPLGIEHSGAHGGRQSVEVGVLMGRDDRWNFQ